MKYISCALILLFANIAVCQIDSSKVIFTSKIVTIADYYESEIEYSSFDSLIKSINCEFINNNLFKFNFVVLKLTVTNNTIKEHSNYNKRSDSLNFVKKNEELDSLKNTYCDYIIAYNYYWDRVYRLKGFKINEFFDFFNFISNDILNKTSNDLVPKNPINRKKRIRNLILSMIDINKMDIKELYQKYYFSNKQYPVDDCSCTKKDNKIHVLK